MSISSEISRISGNISDSLAAVAAKGVTVPSGSNSDDLAGLIAQISGGGGSTTIIVPEQTVTASSSATYINYNAPLVEGETYIVTINGETKNIVCTLLNASYELYFTSLIEVIWIYGQMLFYLDSSSLYGTYTVKVEQETGGGGSTLIEKSITANGVYNASDDDADGYSKVTVNVSGGGGGKNVQVAHGTKRIAGSAYTDVGYEIKVAKTGTYNVYWAGWRSSTSGTNGAQLYVNGTASGDAITTFDSTWTNVQNGSRTNVSLTANDKVTLRARSRGNSYYMYIFFLSIEEV